MNRDSMTLRKEMSVSKQMTMDEKYKTSNDGFRIKKGVTKALKSASVTKGGPFYKKSGKGYKSVKGLKRN